METLKNTDTTKLFLVRDCASPGCYTTIRLDLESVDQRPFCRWCEGGMSHAKLGRPGIQGPATPKHGPYVTMEEAFAERPDLLATLKRVMGRL